MKTDALRLTLCIAIAASGCGRSRLTSPQDAPPQSTAFALSNVAATDVTSTTATITWSTNLTATSIVESGLTTAYTTTTPMYGLTLDHRVTLSGLSPGTQYHYAVNSQDGAGDVATSPDATFTTLPSGDACTPQCGAAACGSDGCGGSCGTCATGENCVAGGCVDASGGTAEYLDVGLAGDFDATQAIYFEQGTSFNDAWPMYWDMNWYSANTTSGGIVEDGTGVWWADAPASVAGKVTARVVKLHHHGRFRVKDALFVDAGTLTLTIRFKDDLLRPAPVFAWDGAMWASLGNIGGALDHAWKTVQLPVPANQRGDDSGTFVFKIGVDAYTDSVAGELSIDKVKLGTSADASEFEPDAPGLWPPAPSASRFANLKQTMEFIPGQGPFFPFGTYLTAYAITDQGGPTTCGTGATDSWKIMADAKMNTIASPGYEEEWTGGTASAPIWNLSPSDYPWALPGISLDGPGNLGFVESLFQAHCHGLKVMPNFYTDTRAYWVVQQYMGEQAAIAAIGSDVAFSAGSPDVLMWYPVDEWDHEGDDYGKPHLYSHLLYNATLQSDPSRPRFVLSMGFNGADVWTLSAKEADAVGEDVYLDDYGGTEPGLAQQATTLDTIRHAVPSTPYIMVAESQPNTTGAAIVAQAYMGITHGASGLLFFNFQHPLLPGLDPTHWTGLRQVGDELFGAEAISPLLLPPAVTLEIMGESGIVTSSSSTIHYVLKQLGTTQYLIAMNATMSAQNVTFTVSGLAAGTNISTRFEGGRQLNSGSGSFSDAFGALERHVYRLGP